MLLAREAKQMSEDNKVVLKREPAEIIVIEDSCSSEDEDNEEDEKCLSICSSEDEDCRFPSPSSSTISSDSDDSELQQSSICNDTASKNPPHELPTIMTWKGYRFTAKERKPVTKIGDIWKGRYRCSIYRSRQGNGCKSTIRVTFNATAEQKIIVDASLAAHTCQQTISIHSPVDETVRFLPCKGVHDARKEMKAKCEELALSELQKSSIVIANEVLAATASKYMDTPYEGLRMDQLRSLVQRTRRGEFADWEGVIASYPLVNCADTDERLFLQFNVNVNVDQKLQKLIGFAHPDLLCNLKHGPVHLFVDCTFSCVPKGFTQCLVIMAHDKSTSMYIPIFYVLMQSKKERAYKHAFRMCVAATEDTMDIIDATCDFEKAIMNALKDQFHKPIVGCEFHWKQAIRRKLLDLNVPRDKISELMDSKGLLHLLTEIPIEDIESKGIPYIRQNFNEGQHKPKFDAFWKYFTETWMIQYNPEDWNVNRGRNNNDLMAEAVLNRTNNPLESFNRKLNGYFPARHPTMVQYVTGIRKLSIDYTNTLYSIRRGHSRPPLHQEVTRHPIPADYATFKSSAAVVKSRYSKLNEYRFLENTCHYDDEDSMMYKVTKVEWWERSKGDMHIVAHRIQCKFQQGYCVEKPAEDFISIEEVMKYTGVTKSTVNNTSNKRKRDQGDDVDLTAPAEACNNRDDDRVHCLCKKRGSGEYCLAKLQQASPSAKRYPRAKYWCCAKNTISRCDFWRLAEREDADDTEPEVEVGDNTSLDATNVICSRCKTRGHYARACTLKTRDL